MLLNPAKAVTQLVRSLTPSWAARLSLNYQHSEFGTVLNRLVHEGPLRVQKSLYPEGHEVCHSIIIHPPAGIAGGDTLEVTVNLEANSHVVLSTPSATKWYKSLRSPSNQSIHISLGNDSKLDWLPQENIFFNGAHSQLTMKLDLASTASAIGWDAYMFGRKASGEIWNSGQVQLINDIYRDGKRIWIERGQIDAGDPFSNSLPQLGGWPITGVLWALGPNCGIAQAGLLSPLMPWTDQLRAGVSYLPQGILLVRVVSHNIESTRNLLIDTWNVLRPLVHGIPAQNLRLWAS